MRWLTIINIALMGALVGVTGLVILKSVAHTPAQPPDQTAGSTITANYGNATTSTAQGASSATVTLVGATGRTIYLTDVDVSTLGGTGEVLVKDGTNVIWQDQIPASTTPYNHAFSTPLKSTAGNNLVISVTSSSTVNVSGYYNP